MKFTSDARVGFVELARWDVVPAHLEAAAVTSGLGNLDTAAFGSTAMAGAIDGA